MTRANFAACVAFVREHEGGNTDTPGDHGGKTGRGGITHTTYDAYRTRMGLPVQDVFKISDAEIAVIYAAEYWKPVRGDEAPAGIDLALFDYAINSGPAKANQANLAANGDIPTVIHKICTSRLAFLHALGGSWARFGKGWARRVSECEALALKMAGELTPEVAEKVQEGQYGKRRRVPQVILGGGAAVGVAVNSGFGHWAVIGIIAFTVIAAAIAIFNARQHGQRTDTLTTAVTYMQSARVAAEAAQKAAAVEAEIKAKAIAADQAVLEAAKSKIAKVGSVG